ncbi:MAG: endonuclease/exonuclease/phosphatase family protein [Rhodobacteraceae bacterium]|nr:endonuclease/exonuclease/phosphatase family protein [Paracoccaceae bacterium]
MTRALTLVALLGLLSAPALADPLRIASWNAELFRKGPGLLLRDIRRGDDPQVAGAIALIAAARADVVVLQGFDFDYENVALAAFAEGLARAGARYPHRLALPTNRGLASGLDLDGDGRAGDGADAQGFGAFYGQGAMAILSRHPIDRAAITDFTTLLWRDLPDAILPHWPDGRPFPSAEAQAVQRLSSSGHWVVPVVHDSGGRFTVMAFHAAPPVFDGPEDRNGRRNHDEIRFWQHLMDGRLGPVPDPPFVIAGGATLDPHDSDGRHEAIRALLKDPRLTDPRPAGDAPAPDQGHIGPNRLDTVDWGAPGRLRADYLLPSAGWPVAGSGLIWPPGPNPASRHALVWVDLTMPAN